MPLRNVADALDSDSHYSTVLELREEHRFMRKSRQGSPRANTHEDTVVALIDYHRSVQSPDDAPPPSCTRRRGSP